MEHLVVPLCRYRLIGRAALVAPGTTSVRFRLSAPYSVTLRPLGLYTCGSNESLPTCCAQIKFPNNTLKWGVGVTITYTKEMVLIKNHLHDESSNGRTGAKNLWFESQLVGLLHYAEEDQ